MNYNFDNNVPIYIQLVEELKINIISGNYELGSRIPSVRELAMEKKVNPNTMQKALTELENMGLIYTERTNGKYVTTDSELIESLKSEYASNLVSNYFDSMKRIGFSEKDAFKYIKSMEGEK